MPPDCGTPDAGAPADELQRPARLQFLLAAPLPLPQRLRQAPADSQVRPPMPGDAEALALLMFEACRGGIDDDGESLAAQRERVEQLFAGDFGTLLWSVSEVTLREGLLVAATLLTLWAGGPFVAYALCLPQHRRQGLARAGLQRAMNRLAAGDEAGVRLVVTQGNVAAEALYESLGFVPMARPPFATRLSPP